MIVEARHRRFEDRAKLVARPITSRSPARLAAVAATAAALVAGLFVPALLHSSADASTELVRNGGFEHGLRGWSPTDPARSVTLTKDSHTGDSAAAVTSLVSGAYSLKDRPNTVRDTAATDYRVSAWVKGDRPGMSVSLLVREVQQRFVPGSRVRVLVGKQTVDAVLGDRRWHRLTMVYRAGAGHQLDLGVFVWNGVPGQSLKVDDVSLIRLDGDTAGPTAPKPSPTASDTTATGGGSREVSVQQPDPSPTVEPVARTGSTQFGYSTWAEHGESWLQAVARRDKDFGKAAVIRVFYPGLPAAWPGNAGAVNRDVVVSFKAPPADIISGKDDERLRTWFRTAPTDRSIYWSYYHEPEDNIAKGEFTAAEYRAAWTHLATLADEADHPTLRATLILMSWSVDKRSGRTWTDYYPGGDVIDVLGWDAYNDAANSSTPAAKRRYDDPAKVFGPAVAASRAAGKPFGFAEWGSLLVPGDPGDGRAAWIRASATYQSGAGAVFSTYFDCAPGADYRIADAASTEALHDVIG